MFWRYACGNSESWNYFYYFLHILNLDIFWVLILQKSIGSRYLVPLTPPTVFGRSFWNFTWAFRMAWRLLFTHYFLHILNLDIFWVLILQKSIGSRYLVPLTPTTVLSRSFWNFTGALRMVWKYACVFSESWNYFYYFLYILNLDIFWVLILQKSIGSRYLVP